MAGVSRQAVSAVESGLSDPSLRVALGPVEGTGADRGGDVRARNTRSRVKARLLAPLEKGSTRMSLAQVGDSFVAAPLIGAAATRSGFVPTSGLADELAPDASPSTRPIWPLRPAAAHVDSRRVRPRPSAAGSPARPARAGRCHSSGGSVPARRRWNWRRRGWPMRRAAIYGTSPVTTTSDRLERNFAKAPR